MAFEEQLPEWENEGTQPPQSKRVEGWLPNEKPPASWFNWLFHRTYKVLQEFQEKAAEKVDVQQVQQTADELRQKLNSHGSEHNHDGSDPIPDLVQLREGVIVESGENANGQYVRFADGTQICWRIIEVDTSRTDTQTFAFPASFSVTREYIAVGYGLHRPGQDHADAWYEGRGVVASTESSWTARFRSDQSSIVDVVEIKVIAIGRWK